MTDTPNASSSAGPAPAARSSWLRRLIVAAVAVVAILGGVAFLAKQGMARDSSLEAGDTAPDFTLPDQTGAPVTLSEVAQGHRGVIVAFYPKDFTPG